MMFARTSAAEPSVADRARVVELLRRGDEAAKVKDWKRCIEARRAALDIEYASKVAGDLGLCEEQAGRFAAAYTHLWRALEAAPANMQTEPWKRYDAAIVRLRERVVLLIITTEPSSARVVVDGVPVGQGDGQTVPVEPGRHTVAGRLAGYEDTSVETDDLRAGAIPNIQITLRRKPVGGPVTPAAPPAASTAARRTDPAESPSGFPCWPAASWRGVLVPAACVGGAAFAVSAATALGLEVHAASIRARAPPGNRSPDRRSAPTSAAVYSNAPTRRTS
jgi:PEGA domain